MEDTLSILGDEGDNDLDSAIESAIKLRNPNPSMNSKAKLLSDLSKQTTFSPVTTGFNDLFTSSWKDVIDAIGAANHFIVRAEILDRNPHLREEEDIRADHL